jgi:uncharacterized protein (DUF305 family)
MRRKLLLPLGALAALALVLAGLAVAAGPRGGMGAGMGAGMRGAGVAASTDQSFITMMIPHHESAVAMAKLALTKAEHAEVKTLAQEIIKTQSAEITQMEPWYRAWYGTDVPEAGMRGMGVNTTALAAAKPFDKAWLAQMTRHHQMGVGMVSMALRTGFDHDELGTLAGTMAKTQAVEIAQMQAWHRAWYGATLPSAGRGPLGGGMMGGGGMTRGAGYGARGDCPYATAA